MKISQITRRDIVDAIVAKKIKWSGRMEEPEFLSRLFNLASLHSQDHRFSDAADDIRQHRVNNYDWADDWVFYDPRFNLMNSDDNTFLAFLCETIHPIVRADSSEAERICQLYNQYLKNDGFQIVEKSRLSGKPVFIGCHIGMGVTPAVSTAKHTLGGTDPEYIAQQISRMEASVITDPALAIGTAKELVESCCKTILEARRVSFSMSADLLDLMKLTVKELELTPDDIPEKAKASGTMKRLLSSLAMIAQGIAELRNHYGTGHGRAAGAKGLTSRHAKLVVGAASTLAVFLAETHYENPRK